jgi:hypothetical protein
MPAIERTNEVKIHRESGNKTIVTVETTAIERATAIVERTACSTKIKPKTQIAIFRETLPPLNEPPVQHRKHTHTHTHTHKK